MAQAPTTLLHPTAAPVGTRLRSFDELPGPRPLPLVGNALQTRTDRIHLDVEKWVRAHGPMLRFALGPMQIMVVSDHTVIHALLRDRPDGIRRPERMTEIFKEMGFKFGVFHAEGDAWERQRRMVMAAFLPTQVRAYHPTLLTVVERLQGRWQRAARERRTLELLPELMRYTVDGVAGLAFGSDVNTLETDGHVIQEHLDKVFPKWFERITAVVPYWRYVKLPTDRALDNSVKAVNMAIEQFMAQARQRLADDPARRAAPRNLLEAMIVQADEATSGLSDDDVAGNVVTMLLAGEDTTATTIAWLMYFLQRYPEVMDKVRAEVMRTDGSQGFLSIEHLAGMSYLDACINETLRLKPVAPFLPLETNKEMVIGDVNVPAGTLIWAAQRNELMDPDRVPQPALFQPERWLQDEVGHAASPGLKRMSVPFGGGPRVCPGRHLAITEIKMATAMWVTRFDVEFVGTDDGEPPAERMAFTMGPVGLRMRVRERG